MQVRLPRKTKGAAEIKTNLSPRQEQIVKLIAKGKTDKEIADSVAIKKNTVGSHVRAILQKLRASSRAHAVAIFLSQ